MQTKQQALKDKIVALFSTAVANAEQELHRGNVQVETRQRHKFRLHIQPSQQMRTQLQMSYLAINYGQQWIATNQIKEAVAADDTTMAEMWKLHRGMMTTIWE